MKYQMPPPLHLPRTDSQPSMYILFVYESGRTRGAEPKEVVICTGPKKKWERNDGFFSLFLSQGEVLPDPRSRRDITLHIYSHVSIT